MPFKASIKIQVHDGTEGKLFRCHRTLVNLATIWSNSTTRVEDDPGYNGPVPLTQNLEKLCRILLE